MRELMQQQKRDNTDEGNKRQKEVIVKILPCWLHASVAIVY